MLFNELDAKTQKMLISHYGPYAGSDFNHLPPDAQNDAINKATAVWSKIEELKAVEPEPEQPKRGRPKVLKDGKTLSFWVDQDTIEDLQHYAKRYNLSFSSLILLFLSCVLESCKQKEEKENAAPAPADPEPTNEETPAQVVVEIPKVNISTVRHF